MSQITGGKVSFSRSVQPAQYETKKAEVELSFTLSEGESEIASIIDSVSALAQAKALEMVGLKKPEQSVVADLRAANKAIAEEHAEKEAFVNKAAQDAKAAYVASKLTAEAKKVAKALAEKSNTAKKPEDGLEIPGFLDRTAAATVVDVPSNPVDPDSDLLAVGEGPKEITDQELVAAVTNTNAIVKDPKKIHALREQFVKLPQGLRDIPQKDRPAFMDGLAKLKAAVK